MIDPTNRPHFLEIMAEPTERPEAAFAGWQSCRASDYDHDLNGVVNENALQSNIDSLTELMTISKSLEVHAHIDNSLAI